MIQRGATGKTPRTAVTLATVDTDCTGCVHPVGRCRLRATTSYMAAHAGINNIHVIKMCATRPAGGPVTTVALKLLIQVMDGIVRR